MDKNVTQGISCSSCLLPRWILSKSPHNQARWDIIANNKDQVAVNYSCNHAAISNKPFRSRRNFHLLMQPEYVWVRGRSDCRLLMKPFKCSVYTAINHYPDICHGCLPIGWRSRSLLTNVPGYVFRTPHSSHLVRVDQGKTLPQHYLLTGLGQYGASQRIAMTSPNEP